MKKQLQKIPQILLIALGIITLALGVIGIFIPLLPTTPFLLISVASFARSSERFYDWLINHPLLGEYLRNYWEGKGIALRYKAIALSALWITISFSAIFLVTSWWVRGILLAIAVGVSTHLLSIPTYRGGKVPDPKSPRE